MPARPIPDFLAGSWTVDETFDVVAAARDDAENAVRFRRGWFLGDGTGAGKGRQVAGILLDNWLKGRRRAVWVSKSDKLIEDAQRDWSALGMERLLVTPLSRFRQGTPIRLAEGILFTTYATLRTDERGEKLSRVRQIVEWLGSDFDGVIIFDESHAMQNAVGGKGERGDQAASQQGRAGLRLQHALPNARVVYVSATGATTVHNLAYAQRLGLWGGEDFPFATRAEFVEAIEDGGVAAMEVLARDLKALGLYAARSLSYEGVEYELIEHQLTPEQIRIYDAYAGAFSIIHNNLDAAMQAANITGETGTLNAQAKSAARSAFESAKQRFFGHLLTAMKTPSLIRSIERDLEAGHAAVIQIVSTGEALMERRLAEIPTEEWNDVQVDITPREYVLDYLAHSFPVQLYEPFTDSEGNLSSRPVYRDGQPVESREAVARRDRLIEKLASLPPVPGALDQIVQRFGTDMVAEVTGRSRRVIRKGDRLMVENRAGSANLAETAAFMDDVKRILVFSDAGGTGRSYHAELSARNRRLRVHYLLEPGWKADAAIQGLGRTNRTNQAQPPLFRPIATDVKAEKRFLSTIARRLDTLGAITRGQRQTGGQGLFRPEDNLESHYGRDALRQLYMLLVRGKVEGCSLQSVRGRDRPEADGRQRHQGRAAADHHLSQSAAGADHRPAERAVHGLRAVAHRPHRRRHRVGHLRRRAGDAPRRELRRHRSAHDLHPSRHRRGDPPAHHHPARAQSPGDAGRGSGSSLRSARRAADQRALGPCGRSGPGAEPHARRWRNRTARAADPPDGEPQPSPEDDGGEPLGRKPTASASPPLGRPSLPRCPRFTDSTIHIVAGLLLPIWKRLPNESTRVYRLQTDAGERIIGRKVSPAWVATALATDVTDADAGGRLRRADGRPHHPRSRRRPAAPPRPRHGREPHRAVRLHRHDARPAQGLRPLPRDHLLEAAHVRADRCERRGGPGEGARPLPDRAHRRAGGRVMPRDASELAHRLAREAEAVCRHYLSNGRREGRYWLVGDVRNTPGRSMFVRLKGRSSVEGTGRQMDRRRHGRARRSARRDPRKLRPSRFPRRRRRGAPLPEPASLRPGAIAKDGAHASTDWIAGGGTAAVRHVAADRSGLS